jgi:site-specific recombinase XerC
MKIFLSAALELLGHVSISTTAVYTHMDFAYLPRSTARRIPTP